MKGNHFFKKALLIVTMGCALVLNGCGGSSGGGTQDTSTGVFIDAAVKGLHYSTPTQSGVTNDRGEFNYIIGEAVTFSIDGLVIGTVTVTEASTTVPVTSLPRYVEVARLLQSLDVDPVEAQIDVTGIVISTDLKTQLKALLENGTGDFDSVFTQTQLDAIESNSQVLLVNDAPVTEQDAIQHLSAFISEKFVASDFNGQTYAVIDDGMMLAFKADSTGIEFSNGDGNGLPYESVFTWSIVNNELVVIYENGEHVTVGLLSVDGNKYSVSVVSVTERDPQATFGSVLYKAKPLSISALGGKIISFDMSGDPDCTAMTLKITGSSSNSIDICSDLDGGIAIETETLSEVAGLDNTIEITGTDAEGFTEVSRIVIIEGDINTGGKLAIALKNDDVINTVFVLGFTIVDKEAELGAVAIPANNLSSLIVGNTLYQHVIDTNAVTGISTLDFQSNGNIVVTDFGVTDTIQYRVDADIIYTIDNVTGLEVAHTLTEQTGIYVRFLDADTGSISTFYFLRADAEAAPAEVL